MCGNKEPCPGAGDPSTTTPNPLVPVKCHVCESTQNDPASFACKDKPETTPLEECKVGEQCRTITYISKEKGGSTLIRGCTSFSNKTDFCDPNPTIPAGKLRCPGCSDPACECFCKQDGCNDAVYEGDGWQACSSRRNLKVQRRELASL